jgi:hypothetical protein
VKMRWGRRLRRSLRPSPRPTPPVRILTAIRPPTVPWAARAPSVRALSAIKSSATPCSPAGSDTEGNAASAVPNGRGGCMLTSLFVRERPGWVDGPPACNHRPNFSEAGPSDGHTFERSRCAVPSPPRPPVSLLRRSFSAASTQTRFGIERCRVSLVKRALATSRAPTAAPAPAGPR